MRETTEYRISEYQLPRLTKLVAKLNKRADKLGLKGFNIFEVEPPYVEEVKRKNDVIEFVTFHNVRLEGETPVADGWDFVATIEPTEDGNIILHSPSVDIEVPERYKTHDARHCDHCKTRRNRINTFILHKDDTFMLVGRNCLADFIRNTDVHGWAAYLAEIGAAVAAFEAVDGLGEDSDLDLEGYRGSRSREISRDEFLLTVSAAERTFGWVSRGVAREQDKNATADTAMSWIFDSDPKIWGDIDLTPTAKDKKRVAEALAWINGKSKEEALDERGDYMWNLWLGCKSEGMPYRATGIVASLISAYERAMGRELKRKESQKRLQESEWVGEEKKRQDFTLTLDGERYIESQWGSTTLYMFRDQDGNSVKWFSSNDLDLEKGETYTIKATVKKHDTYNDIKSTLITRGKLQKAA